MANCLLGVIGYQALELSLCLLVLEMSRPGPRKDRSELRPGIRGTHVHDSNGLDARLRWVDAKQGRGLAGLDTPPELPLGGDDEVLIERIGMGLDL